MKNARRPRNRNLVIIFIFVRLLPFFYYYFIYSFLSHEPYVGQERRSFWFFVEGRMSLFLLWRYGRKC